MPNKMLIDASHPEETRVVVLHGSRIEEFDFESQDKKQLKGNIYLARVTRVEPSLQAAFVEYGGNRHGFLAFSEIHPDYYQIPVADRQALLRAEAEAVDEEDDEEATGSGEEQKDRNRNRRRRRGGKNRERNGEDSRRGVAAGEEAPAEIDEMTAPGESAGLPADDGAALNDAMEGPEAGRLSAAPFDEYSDETADAPQLVREGDSDPASRDGGSDLFDDLHDIAADSVELAPAAETDASGGGTSEASNEEDGPSEDDEDRPADEEEQGGGSSMAAAIEGDVISEEAPARSDAAESERGGRIEEIAPQGDETEVESVGAEDALEEVQRSRRSVRRSYKIQEVIKRRQILLVQVVKEERGNKGAALTTYLSLAGRYSVLMPNTARGGGISRKITNIQDRKRLKEVVEDLEVPQGMGVILRTAGESRTKAEIKRDYEYLMRMWETVRNLTLASTAPALVYEEGSLIKRSVRDLYNKDIDEVIVAGDEGYREAKDFMRMLMPSHAKVVQPYRDTTPLFARNGIDAQLDRMLQPQVTLKSGGYIIINQTEALVSIDVNSGRSTREHSIEDTALQTNLEASEEVARQLRLRDLAGLIVIDYIDMEENRNNRAVEKKLKDCLKNDRARIQVGRISHFGLMEMSRQRIRASVLESTMKPCPQCGGTGHIRSDSSVALFVVRGIEEFLLKDSKTHITVRTPVATALYVLNHKRSNITEMEVRFGVKITVEADETVGAQHFAIFRGAIADKPAISAEAITAPAYVEPDDMLEDEEVIAEDEAAEPAEREIVAANDDEGQRDRKRRRRKRKRGGRDRDPVAAANDDDALAVDGELPAADETDEEDEPGITEAEVEQEGVIAAEASDEVRKKRRRGKRGGKLAARGEEPSGEADVPDSFDSAQERDAEAEPRSAVEATEAATQTDQEDVAEPVKKPRRSRAKKAVAAVAETQDVVTALDARATLDGPREGAAPEALPDGPAMQEPTRQEETTDGAEAKPARPTRRKAMEDVSADPEPEQASDEPVDAASNAEEKPKRGGWWQRRSFF